MANGISKNFEASSFSLNNNNSNKITGNHQPQQNTNDSFVSKSTSERQEPKKHRLLPAILAGAALLTGIVIAVKHSHSNPEKNAKKLLNTILRDIPVFGKKEIEYSEDNISSTLNKKI